MSTSPAYARKVQIAPDSSGSIGTPADLGVQNKIDLDEPADNVDTSQTNSAGYHLRMTTLLDSKLTLEVLFDSADTAQTTLRNGRLNRVQVWVKVFLTATTGIIYPMVVDGVKTSFDPGQPVRQTFSLSGNGAQQTF